MTTFGAIYTFFVSAACVANAVFCYRCVVKLDNTRLELLTERRRNAVLKQKLDDVLHNALDRTDTKGHH